MHRWGHAAPNSGAYVSWSLTIAWEVRILVWSDTFQFKKVSVWCALFRVIRICSHQDSSLSKITPRYVTDVLQTILLPLTWLSGESLFLLELKMGSDFSSLISRRQLAYHFWRTQSWSWIGVASYVWDVSIWIDECNPVGIEHSFHTRMAGDVRRVNMERIGDRRLIGR